MSFRSSVVSIKCRVTPICPVTDSISCPPSFNHNKVRWDECFSYIDSHYQPASIFITLTLYEANHTSTKLLNYAAISVISCLFLFFFTFCAVAICVYSKICYVVYFMLSAFISI